MAYIRSRRRRFRRTRRGVRRSGRRRFGGRRRRVFSKRAKAWKSKQGWSVKFKKFNNAVVPNVTYARLTYRANTILQPLLDTNYVATNTVYALNNPYDPDSSLGNVSAQGFDYFRDYYARYMVYKAKAYIKFLNSSDNFWTVFAVPQMGGSNFSVNVASADVNQVLGVPYIKYKNIGPATGSNNVKKIVCSWSISEDQAVNGRGNAYEYSSTFDATVSSAPSAQRQLYIGIMSSNGQPFGTATAIMNAQVTIVYYTKFFPRKATPESTDPE